MERDERKIMKSIATGDEAPKALLESEPLTETQKFAREVLFWNDEHEKNVMELVQRVTEAGKWDDEMPKIPYTLKGEWVTVEPNDPEIGPEYEINFTNKN